ncbi:helix-hairpin-helix domain-containing protein [Clostridium sp.]|uniref:helix-hairpin-helix domain-containing protein n=1 Tax=Clostridium sp. TaxID=1506 RepID=UPI0028484A76|nr:helix-hairpin-helix domain-containing protein [Clostridium sp.]MDR3594766.1 helix-hairpin-helix domain-containing protein [Clostridium sp.]
MVEELLKDKKKIGILIALIITVAIIGILYLNSGFKELKKNDTESIFVEENTDASNNDNIKNTNTNNKNSNSKNNIKENKETIASQADKNIVVEIKGEVKKPDVYILNENSIIKDLIEAAGGLTENADLSNINRAKKLQNHDLIYITNKNEVMKGIQNTDSNSNSKNKENSDEKININTATTEELKKINGIGDAKAKNILEYREKNGDFKSIEDIKNVTGISEKMFEKIKEQIEI